MSEQTKPTRIESSAPRRVQADWVQRLGQVFEHAAAGMALLSIDGQWLEVNPAFCRLLGYDRDALIGRSFLDLTHPDDVRRSIEHLRRLQDREIRSFAFDKRYRRSNGDTIWVGLEVSVVLDDLGLPDFIIVHAHDISASRRVKEQLADREARLSSVIRSMGEGVLVIEADGAISLANERARQILALGEDRMHDFTLRDLAARCGGFGESDGAPERFPAAHSLATGEPMREVSMKLRNPGQPQRWIEISTEPVRGQSGAGLRAVVATFSDITDRVHTQHALKDSEERLSLALEGAKLGMWDWDLERSSLKFNRIAERILGFGQGDVAPRLDSVWSLVHPDEERRMVEAMESHLAGERTYFEVDVRMRRKAGDYVWVNLRARVTEWNAKGKPSRVTGMLIDISRRKQLEERLERLATTDELTGLSNRRDGVERLKSEIERARRDDSTFSMILLDIDHFKAVNDRFGHDVGDRILTDVAELLKGRSRSTDTASRWGGEEFALVLPGTARDGAVRFAEELLKRMDGIRTPDGRGISASFGVVDYREDESASELVKRADRMMYRAKHAGRGRVETESAESAG